MKAFRTALVILALLIAMRSSGYEVQQLVTWNGNIAAWEVGTETDLESQVILPLLGALSADGLNLLKIYPAPDGFSQDLFQPIPSGALRPIRDFSLQTFVANDSAVWVEDWPTNGDPPILHKLSGLPPARYSFDFGGFRNLDQRWQWMMTYADHNNTTRLYEISYSSPNLAAEFTGSVTSEPAMHETRTSGQVDAFQISFSWPTQNLNAIVRLREGNSTPDTIAWTADYLPVALSHSPRLIDGTQPTLYGIVPVSGNNYLLYHQAGDLGCLTRQTIDSQVPPRMLSTPAYQKTNLLDPDFVAYVVRINGFDTIRWSRFQYQFGYTTPEIQQGEIPVDGSVNRLRVQYVSSTDQYGPYEAWYIFWSEYLEETNATQLNSLLALRDPSLDTSIEPTADNRPSSIRLLPVYPNPFNSATVIPFEVDQAGESRISIHDLLGRQVALLQEGVLSPGSHRLLFQPSGSLASGTYLVRIEQAGHSTAQRIHLLK